MDFPVQIPAQIPPQIPVQSFAVAHLRRRPLVVEAPAFVAGLSPDSRSPYINYATPLPGAEPGAADVAALVEVFRARGLKPRLEFAPSFAPAVRPALEAAGFTVEEEHVYLACVPGDLRVPAGPQPGTPVTEAEHAAVDAALAESFGGEHSSSPEGVARLLRTVRGGGAVRFVRAPDGSCAGGASCSAVAVGTAELSGVGTRPAFRGRGIGGAVTAALTAAMFAKGAGSVWLEYGGEGSRRVYERVGYRPAGTRLYLSLES